MEGDLVEIVSRPKFYLFAFRELQAKIYQSLPKHKSYLAKNKLAAMDLSKFALRRRFQNFREKKNVKKGVENHVWGKVRFLTGLACRLS